MITQQWETTNSSSIHHYIKLVYQFIYSQHLVVAYMRPKLRST